MDRFPSRIQEEIQIFNLSLPMQSISPSSPSEFDDFEPELADLLRAAECPVCRCIPNPPIYNCVNGHFSCNSCLPRLASKRCAYCLAKFTTMRNYPLENLVTARVFLCDFRNAGCKNRDMNMTEYEEHMRTCWFRSLALPRKHAPDQENRRNFESTDEFNCPRCNCMNSKRKLKCQNCQVNLRVPTPMCSRPLRAVTGLENGYGCPIQIDED